MSSPSSAQINAKIYNSGPSLFEAVRAVVIEHATADSVASAHKSNQQKLIHEVEEVLTQAISRDVNHQELWQVMWQRIVYAGTLSRKANAEIKSMQALIPLFRDLDNYQPGRYVFDEGEWNTFSDYWKQRLPKSKQASWIQLSKADRDWNPATHFANAKTTPEVWKVLTKDNASYPGLRFSALRHKIKRYYNVAAQLHGDRQRGGNPLDHFMDGYQFSQEHKIGQAWLQERHALGLVQARFEALLGNMTALHTMMDLGLKTIKPDRVMTYLFSQLGWLQTLPPSLTKEEVLGVYTKLDVVEEMTNRADVFAASLEKKGYAQAHRLLDIWLVKYGQEPEPYFGITVNLQSRGKGIRGLMESLTVDHPADQIDAQEAAQRWPMGDFSRIDVKAVSEATQKNRSGRRSPRIMTREQAEKVFYEHWKKAYAELPHIYPSREQGIANAPKEAILRLIERGVDPDEAFRQVLDLESDD